MLLFGAGFGLGAAVVVGLVIGFGVLGVTRGLPSLPSMPSMPSMPELPAMPWSSDASPAARLTDRRPASSRADPGPRPVPDGPQGPLAGLVVYLSAGHGLLLHRQNHDGEPISWGTQRSTRYGMVEDAWTAAFVADWLSPALEQAGATVLALRERDRNPVEVVADDGGDGFTAYADEEPVFDDLANGGSATRIANGGSAAWRITVPYDGHWYLYTRWLDDGDQDTHAIYTVASGEEVRTVVVDQTRHGGHWWPLGDDCLPAGAEIEVTLTGSGVGPLSADAVRIGGGTFTVLLPWNDRIRQADYFDVSFTHQLERLGAPAWLGTYSCGNPVSDMRLRPHWASWAGETDPDAVYLSIHTNASPRGRPKGLTAFYGVDSTPPTPADPESVRFASLLDHHVYQSVHRNDKGYLDRGTRPGDYSEVSPVHNTLPAALLEMGFHDNPEEARRLQTNAYRRDAAAGIVAGMVEWRNSRTMPPPLPIAHDPDRTWSIAE